MAKFIAKIGDERVVFPDSFDDITIARQLAVGELVESKMPEPYKQQLFGKTKPDDDDLVPTPRDKSAFIEFKVQYLSAISGCDPDTLRTFSPQRVDGIVVDLNWLFERCSRFLQPPTERDVDVDAPFIEVDGVKYYRAPITDDLFGEQLLFGQTDFQTWAAGQTIMAILEDVKKGNFQNEYVVALAAVMYRPKVKRFDGIFGRPVTAIQPFDDQSNNERARVFRNAPASQIYAAYFFLCGHLSKRLDDSQRYFQAVTHQQTHPTKWSSAVRWMQRQFVELDLGFYKVMRWLRMAYSRAKVKRLWNR